MRWRSRIGGFSCFLPTVQCSPRMWAPHIPPPPPPSTDHVEGIPFLPWPMQHGATRRPERRRVTCLNFLTLSAPVRSSTSREIHTANTAYVHCGNGIFTFIRPSWHTADRLFSSAADSTQLLGSAPRLLVCQVDRQDKSLTVSSVAEEKNKSLFFNSTQFFIS